MTRLEIGHEAEREFADDAREYELQRPGRGGRFTEAVNDALEMIARLPRSGVPYKLGYRKRVVLGFPDAIFYREYDDFAWVAAIYHGHRKPDGWMNRRRD